MQCLQAPPLAALPPLQRDADVLRVVLDYVENDMARAR